MTAFGEFHPLTQLECMVLGDDDLGIVDVLQHIRRDQLATSAISIRRRVPRFAKIPMVKFCPRGSWI